MKSTEIGCERIFLEKIYKKSVVRKLKRNVTKYHVRLGGLCLQMDIFVQESFVMNVGTKNCFFMKV